MLHKVLCRQWDCFKQICIISNQISWMNGEVQIVLRESVIRYADLKTQNFFVLPEPILKRQFEKLWSSLPCLYFERHKKWWVREILIQLASQSHWEHDKCICELKVKLTKLLQTHKTLSTLQTHTCFIPLITELDLCLIEQSERRMHWKKCTMHKTINLVAILTKLLCCLEPKFQAIFSISNPDEILKEFRTQLSHLYLLSSSTFYPKTPCFHS